MRARFILSAAFAITVGIAAAEDRPDPTLKFIRTHCAVCHDAKTKSGGLDLTALKLDFEDPASFAKWVLVHDRVRAGEMPPPQMKSRPPEAETRVMLASLDRSLRSANAAKQAREGRAPARRLNRDEYQNTLRDLLGVQKDYRLQLPDDGMALGFDKVGSALSVSAEHFQSYLAVAHAALDEVIATGPAPKVLKAMLPQRLMAFKEEKDFTPQFLRYTNIGNQPDSLVRFDAIVERILGLPQGAPLAGLYRFRVHSRAWGAERVKTRIQAGGLRNADPSRLVTYTDFPRAGATVEVTTYLQAGQTLRVSPLGTTPGGSGPTTASRIRQKGVNPDTYQGPGLALEWVEVEGPLHDSWPPPGHRRLFGDLDFARATRADAERVLRGFLHRAFRRPVRDEELQPYLALYDGEAKEAGFLAGIKVALEAALCSPHFLYLHAPAGPLDDFALASRLSYFLWCSMPDDELSGLAAKGQLRRPEILRAQVERLLNDPKAAAFNESFTGQWLDLRKIAATSPDAHLYPEWEELIEWACVHETRLFFNEVLQNDLSLTNFVQSDFAMLNDRLATHYGIPGVKGIEFRKVALPPDSVRGGVLAQASVLKVTANGTTTSPVLRGVWVREHILGKPVPPPPPGVPAVEPDIRGATTIREQLAKHRADTTCAKCHAKIDPPGFALESFDVIGGWRDRYRIVGDKARERIEVARPLSFDIAAFLRDPGKGGPVHARVGVGSVVDSSGQMPEGSAFPDYLGFRRALLSDPDQLARALAQHLVTYASGAGLQYADRADVESIVSRVRAQNYGFRALIHEIVRSPLFLKQ